MDLRTGARVGSYSFGALLQGVVLPQVWRPRREPRLVTNRFSEGFGSRIVERPNERDG